MPAPGGGDVWSNSPLGQTLRVVFPYAVVAGLWIYFSDRFVGHLGLDPEEITVWSTMKGWAFVATTSALLGGLLLRVLGKLHAAQRALRDSEERYRLMAENTGDVIWLVDLESLRFRYVSPSVERLRGFTAAQVLEQTIPETLTPASAELLARLLPERLAAFAAGDESTRTQTYELDQTRRGGGVVATEVVSTLLADAAGRPTQILGVTRDVTERRCAEEERERLAAQLAQAQKMESVGRLAGGVAHDFNNMLSVIVGRAELALLRAAPEDPLRPNLEEILRTAVRSADLTRQLLAFARVQPVAPRVLDLNEAVSGTLTMLRRLIGEDVTLVWQPGADAGRVRIDPSQLDQILANLAVNARDAMVGQGTLTLTTRGLVLDASRRPDRRDLPPGPYVELTVTDTGQGIPAPVREHLFEPFYTTKDVGKGTGLGLATVFGIVKQNGGFIEVESEPGQGATFRVAFPRAGDEQAAAHAEEEAVGPGGTETVLVVEDEEAILSVVRSFLDGAGFRVLGARGPEEALRAAGEHRGPIHLLLTDIVMPGMNGRELWERVRAAHPESRCLYMSGYTADVIANRGILEEGVQFIAKPMRRDDLLKAVRRVLDERRQPHGQPGLGPAAEA